MTEKQIDDLWKAGSSRVQNKDKSKTKDAVAVAVETVDELKVVEEPDVAEGLEAAEEAVVEEVKEKIVETPQVAV